MPRTVGLIRHIFGLGGEVPSDPPPPPSRSAYEDFGVNEDIAAHRQIILIRLKGLLHRAIENDRTERARLIGIVRVCASTRAYAVKNAQDLLAANFALPAHLEATGIELSQLQEVEDPCTLPVVDEWNGGEASVRSALRATVAVREAFFWIEQVCAPSGGTSTPCIDMSSSTCA